MSDSGWKELTDDSAGGPGRGWHPYGRERRSRLWLISLLALALLFSGLGCGSASSSNLAQKGCRTEVRDVESKILPRTSGLSCGTIQAILLVLPRNVGVGSIEAGNPENSQVCRLYPRSALPLEVRCRHGDKYFEVVATAR
jgi:hypothetical protein